MLKKFQHLLKHIAKYVSGVYALDVARQIAKEGSLVLVITFLKKKYKFFRPTSVRFLIVLYHYLLSHSKHLPILKKETTFIIHFCCWGTEYADKAKCYLFPSLLAKGNLPTIAKKHKTTILIHCDLQSKNIFSHSPVIREVKKYAYIKFILLPKTLLKAFDACFKYTPAQFFKKLIQINNNIKYFMLGGLQSQALAVGIEYKSYLSFLMPDIVLSDKFLTKIVSAITDKKVVVATSLRADYPKVTEELNPFFDKKKKTRLSISANELITINLRNMHTISKNIIVSESTHHFYPCAQLLFETPNGFVMRAFHYHPILLDCCHYHYLFKPDYHPIDNTILNQLLSSNVPFEQQIFACDSLSEVSCMELSNTVVTSHVPKFLNYNQLTTLVSDNLKKTPHAYNTPLNCYFFSIKNRFESPSIYKTGNFINDDLFLADVISALNNSHIYNKGIAL